MSRSRNRSAQVASCYTAVALTAPSNGSARAFAYFALFTEIGLVLFVTTLGGALAGAWLDGQLKTTPLFIVGGFLAGATLGAFADWRLISRFLAKLDRDA